MIYLDNAATSKFKPPAVIRAALKQLKNSANPGRGAHIDAVNAAMLVTEARESVRELINNPRSEIIFTKNCTEALNLAIFGTIKEGGHVITTVNEHNSVLRPLFELERQKRIRLTVLPESGTTVTPEEIERSITRDTYLVCVNCVSNVTGEKADMEAIASVTSKHDILLLADGAQALGHINIETEKTRIDLLAAPGHKGLHGPQGSGFLAFSPDIRLTPLLFGGTGTNSDSVYQPLISPEAYESGTMNTPAIAGLNEGINWTLKNQTEISKRLRRLTHELIRGLGEINRITPYTYPADLNGVVSFNIDGMTSSAVGDILNEKFNIAVRTGLHCAPLIHKRLGTLKTGTVRASIGYNNTENDIIRLLSAVKDISSK